MRLKKKISAFALIYVQAYQMANIPDAPASAKQNLILISLLLGEKQPWQT